jgi:hypothetical protein
MEATCEKSEKERGAIYGMVWYGMVWYGMVWYGTYGTCFMLICWRFVAKKKLLLNIMYSGRYIP